MANLAFHAFASNELWCPVVMLAAEIMATTQMIAFARTQARRWEPKKLRARLFEISWTIASQTRQTTLHLAATASDVKPLIKKMTRIAALCPT
nr:transposase [Arthrobacter polaris]